MSGYDVHIDVAGCSDELQLGPSAGDGYVHDQVHVEAGRPNQNYVNLHDFGTKPIRPLHERANVGRGGS